MEPELRDTLARMQTTPQRLAWWRYSESGRSGGGVNETWRSLE
jgi:hypothetical protein